MGIDTMLYTLDLPAGTYTEGDELTLTLKAGPIVVRDGLGEPILKSITTGELSNRSGAKSYFKFYVQNSNWNDPVINGPSYLADLTAIEENTGGYHIGNDCPMQVNSSFTVKAVCTQTVTTTIGNTLFCTIDIEYPSVPGLMNPTGEKGTPCSLEYEFDSATLYYSGQVDNTSWVEQSVDMFKAGYRYLLQKVTVDINVAGIYFLGFIKFSGGASMGGLSRIIPASSVSSAVAKVITYTAPEVKGPFNIAILPSSSSDSTDVTSNVNIICDYVKRM